MTNINRTKIVKKQSTDTPSAIVFGGGLAGMVAALELVKLNYSVNLYERSDHLGGKAASLLNKSVYDGEFKPVPKNSRDVIHTIRSDHGYHVFPKWYRNMRQLWKEIGLIDNVNDPKNEVIESGDYFRLQRGNRYDFKAPLKTSLIKKICILDLMRQPDDVVDDITCRGFFFSRIYNPKDSVSLNDLFLNALSIAEYDIGARVVRDLFRQWYPVIGEPNWDALRGDLSSVLIDKIEKKIKTLSTKNKVSFNIHLNTNLEAITFANGSVKFEIKPNGKDSKIITRDKRSPIVMAIPFNDLLSMQTDDLYKKEPSIKKTNYLRSNQYSALDIYFTEKLPNVPKDHFDLEGSIYNLSAFDISQYWPQIKKMAPHYNGTVLQFVAGNCKELEGLSESKLMEELVQEISAFIPHANSNGIKYIVPHPNSDLPLFVNDVGTWNKRPETRGEWFYYAGDYTRNPNDITSMEGAVRSGLDAAEAIRQDLCPNKPKVKILEPNEIRKEKLTEIDEHIESLLLEMQKMEKFLKSI